MKALILYGGIRFGKNTDRVLCRVIEKLESKSFEVVRYDLKMMNIAHCTGCNACSIIGKCVIEDEMSILYKEFNEAEAVVFASPLYFNSVSSISKVMIDRCQVYWGRKFALGLSKTEKKKSGIMVSTCGTPISDKTFTGFDSVVELFFKSIDVVEFEKIYIGNTDQGDVDEDTLAKIDIF